MSKVGYEEALAENEALKDQIAIILAQKKGWRKSCEKLKKEIVSLKQDLEVAKDNEIHLETINELREENKKLKEDREKCINALSEQFTFKTTQDGVFCDVFDIVRKQAIKEFAEKLENELIKFVQDEEDENGKISSATLFIDGIGIKSMNGDIITYGVLYRLLKEYGVEL